MSNEQSNSATDKSKTSLVEFFNQTQREVSKVTWPTRKEIYVTTALIVVFALLMGIFFLIVDSGLGYVISRLLGMNS